METIITSSFIVILCMAAVFVAWIRGVRIWNPLTIILFWWGGWFAVACLQPFGLYEIKLPTFLIFTAFVFTLACSVALTIQRNSGVSLPLTPQKDILSTISLIAAVVVSPAILYFAFVSYMVFGSYSGTENIRTALLMTDHSLIFGSDFMRSSFILLAGSTVYLSNIAACIQVIVYNKWIAFVFTFILTVMYAGIEGGRSAVFRYVFLLVITASFHFSWREWLLFLRKRVLLIVSLVILMTLVLAVNTIRRDGETSRLGDHIIQFVNYHTCGPLLFQSAYEDPSSVLSKWPQFGRCSASGAEQVVLMGIRRIIPGYVTEFAANLSEYVYDFKQVGDNNGQPITSNAYYTTLFLLYADFRWGGVTIGAFLSFWWIERKRQQWVCKHSNAALWMGINLALFWVFSIYQSPLQNFWFVPSTFVILIYGIFEKYSGKVEEPNKAQGKLLKRRATFRFNF